MWWSLETDQAQDSRGLNLQRPIKHAHVGFGVAPGGPAVAGRRANAPPRRTGCRLPVRVSRKSESGLESVCFRPPGTLPVQEGVKRRFSGRTLESPETREMCDKMYPRKPAAGAAGGPACRRRSPSRSLFSGLLGIPNWQHPGSAGSLSSRRIRGARIPAH